ncbi:MAG: AraC family transcriptional regulator [Deferribacterales bacterium]
MTDFYSASTMLLQPLLHSEGLIKTCIKGLSLFISHNYGTSLPTIYSPSVCFILDGTKHLMVEETIYKFSKGQFLSVSVDMPATGCVIEASEDKPYICAQIDVNTDIIREIIMSGEISVDSSAGHKSITIGDMDSDINSCLFRLLGRLSDGSDNSYLSGLIMKELHYRLLKTNAGRYLAGFAADGSNMYKIAEVISIIRRNYDKSIQIEQLAQIANMGISSFHSHFKNVTSMTPHQFLKKVRLTEARRIMLTEKIDASATAYRVGYESPSQFSREYSKHFGAPPASDIIRIKNSAKRNPAI